MFLLTGCNLGNRQEQLHLACLAVEERIGTVTGKSAIYETSAWGVHDQPDYLNQVLRVITGLRPREVLLQIGELEIKLGRRSGPHWGAREMDVDILLYDDEVLNETGLQIPHPRMAQRRFVLTPLAELAPDLIHPVSGERIADMLLVCKDPLAVRPVDKKDSGAGKIPAEG